MFCPFYPKIQSSHIYSSHYSAMGPHSKVWQRIFGGQWKIEYISLRAAAAEVFYRPLIRSIQIKYTMDEDHIPVLRSTHAVLLRVRLTFQRIVLSRKLLCRLCNLSESLRFAKLTCTLWPHCLPTRYTTRTPLPHAAPQTKRKI
jgi:hypothetical protein